MTSIKFIDRNFWINPPWGNGREKYRLGLKPIEKNKWFEVNITESLKTHKKNLFAKRYEDVIATTLESTTPQELLAKKLKINKKIFLFFPLVSCQYASRIYNHICTKQKNVRKWKSKDLQEILFFSI